MDKMFEKIGIYDFMGIWGAGTVVCSYFLIITFIIGNINILDIIQGFQADFSLLIIFAFCVISYITGTYLHEIGKRFCELFKNTFEIQNIEKVKTKYKPLDVDDESKFFAKLLNRIYIVFHPIQYRKYHLIHQTGRLKNKELVDEAISYLKHKESTKIIDRYHSIYGLTRGIWMGFSIHLIVFSTWVLFNLDLVAIKHIIILLFDIFSIFLYFVRTHRYYITWIKNISIQYDLCKEKEPPINESN